MNVEDFISKILTYEKMIAEIYRGLNLSPPQTRQMSVFDMEM